MHAAPHGLLVVDKPAGMTSRDVVNRAQRWFPRRIRLGHTGTLDPLATGVLVICVGAATRLTEYVQDMAKTYRAGLLLGAHSDTDDADGTVTPIAVDRPPDEETVRAALGGFVGEIEQVPPAYSAAKVTGRRAYELARRGEEVALQPRRVWVYGTDLVRYTYPHLDIEVRCGKGTYIRSLARDLGERLSCGCLVRTLRRTRVGPFDVTGAVGLDADGVTVRAHLLPLARAVSELPYRRLTATEMTHFCRGEPIPLPQTGEAIPADRAVALFDAGGENLVGIARADPARRLLRPVKVLSSGGG
jgi:tRNA pseudouridine55 synthase